MSLQPLTAAGVTAKTTELYALSNSLLAAQADAVQSDFATWIKGNFTLSTPQSDFLTGMNATALKYYGAQCSVAFRSRLTISLSTPTPVGSHKFVGSVNTLEVSTDSAGTLQTTGSLTFKIEYLV
ncbi:hypothetical protein [Mucilaginibacter polytrichastri]|uniref:Uncharacterized protein n=1 Tax=Mucilaginibacter polytrichastri TaxID=1302689 RepID=A0A1Q5ZVE3_9SPHI|nr:hypothetical protein [Mucilaginibacter polytrichastri]OKS85703.1 hypothetical protein RG47T_1149 [Mucilaginibacter polytrichastri]SFS61946.1 hypothetical protein SAMN04487890_102426 [Mucilaginibacter polytrichastri]